jgi:hypothetical protein
VQETSSWYRARHIEKVDDMTGLGIEQIIRFVHAAQAKKILWSVE